MRSKSGATARHRRMLVWGFAVILAGTFIMPLSGYVYVSLAPGLALAQSEQTPPANPRANYWRNAREGNTGYVASSGAYTKNFLIQNGGQMWREWRNGPLAAYGAGLIAVALAALVLFHFIAGPARLAEGRSGVKIYRWSLFERVLHWYVAILFIILAITGLSLLYGRAVLIPVLGPQGFAAYASVAMSAHNYLGLFFVAGLVIMLAIWAKESLFRRYDWDWFKKGGGYIGKQHPHAGRVNAGEKLWFWLLFVFGLAVSITGVLLIFPNLDYGMATFQLSTLIHAALGIVLIAMAFGHIYLGTLGNEGTFEGMASGYVDENWARQHHDLWYEEVRRSGGDRVPERTQPSGRSKTPVG